MSVLPCARHARSACGHGATWLQSHAVARLQSWRCPIIDCAPMRLRVARLNSWRCPIIDCVPMRLRALMPVRHARPGVRYAIMLQCLFVVVMFRICHVAMALCCVVVNFVCGSVIILPFRKVVMLLCCYVVMIRRCQVTTRLCSYVVMLCCCCVVLFLYCNVVMLSCRHAVMSFCC